MTHGPRVGILQCMQLIRTILALDLFALNGDHRGNLHFIIAPPMGSSDTPTRHFSPDFKPVVAAKKHRRVKSFFPRY
jgi:hypothetical protein